jgi:hypothetical protein
MRYEIEVMMSDPPRDRQRILAAIGGAWQQASTPPAVAVAWPPRMPVGGIPMPASAPAPAPFVDRGALSIGQWLELHGPVLQIGATDPGEVQGVIDKLRAAGLIITRLEQVRPSLEDLFMEAITDRATGQYSTPGAARQAATPPPLEGRA